MKSRAHRTGSVVSLLMASLLAVGCGQAAPTASGVASAAPSGGEVPSTAPSTSADNVRDATIRWAADEPSQGLDPQIASAGASLELMGLMYDTLFDFDDAGQLVPWLAESSTTSTDGLTWTFKLRADGKFSDGSPITSEDVKFSLDRAREGDVLKGQLALVESVDATDPSTVTVKLSKPNGQLPLALAAAGSAGVLSKAAVESRPDYFTSPTVTSGPYVLGELVPQSHATLEANSSYWHPDLPKVKFINYVFQSDATVRQTMVAGGAADIAPISPAGAAEVGESDQFKIVTTQNLSPLFWGWDWSKAPFDNELVRQAFAFAIDRQSSIAACAYGGPDKITWGAGPSALDPNYVEINTYNVDRATALQQAGALLDQAGWKLGSNGVRVADGVAGFADGAPFKVAVPYEGTWKVAECNTLLLQQALKEVGVEIEPQAYDRAAYWGDVGAGKFTMYHGGAWAADALDFFNIWYRSGGSLTALTTHLEDPAIDAQIDSAVSSTDPAAVKSILGDLQAMAVDELYTLVWGQTFNPIMFTSKLDGFVTTPSTALSRGLMYTDYVTP
jgi:peptide/nickel transport system substrate-binding protein